MMKMRERERERDKQVNEYSVNQIYFAEYIKSVMSYYIHVVCKITKL